MKFLFHGHLFTFLYNGNVKMITPWGDVYVIYLTQNPDSPFTLLCLEKINPNENMEQVNFERELTANDN